jgi:hypothetical protein
MVYEHQSECEISAVIFGGSIIGLSMAYYLAESQNATSPLEFTSSSILCLCSLLELLTWIQASGGFSWQALVEITEATGCRLRWQEEMEFQQHALEE